VRLSHKDGVNIAARPEGIAEPGGVCISDDAQRQIRGKVDVAFDDMGPQTLKNIAEPMRAWRLNLGGQSAATAQPVSPASPAPALVLPDKPSIAVLPFQNMSGDPDQEYFADGIVEDIITALSRFKSLFVIARNSSFTYKGKAVDIKQVGRELGVRYVLEGSVRKAGGKVRITGQLIESDTRSHLWADRFDGSLQDVFELQDQVTASVVAAIGPEPRTAGRLHGLPFSARKGLALKYATDVTKEKMEFADLLGQVNAIKKSQAVIEFKMDGTVITANENFLNVMGYRLDEIQGKHHSMFAEAAFANSPDYKEF
jgi:TolB-like protein